MPTIDPPCPRRRRGVKARIYFISTDPMEFVKIGWTEDVLRRLAELQCGNPSVLRLLGDMPGTLDDEAAIHRRFLEYRHFREWFFCSETLTDFIIANCDEHVPDRTNTLVVADLDADDGEIPF